MFYPSGSRKLTCTNPRAPVEETTGPRNRVDDKKIKNPGRNLQGSSTVKVRGNPFSKVLNSFPCSVIRKLVGSFEFFSYVLCYSMSYNVMLCCNMLCYNVMSYNGIL